MFNIRIENNASRFLNTNSLSNRRAYFYIDLVRSSYVNEFFFFVVCLKVKKMSTASRKKKKEEIH